MTRASRSSSAFTLIELLVVIAIIAILIALLVPAVQKVRAAAARATCQNNLKQLGVGLHAYYSAQGTFPPGAVCDKAFNPDPSWSWAVLLLPYLEQGPLAGQINASPVFPTPPANQRLLSAVLADKTATGVILLQTPLSVFLCPSDDTGNQLNQDRKFNNGVLVARANYVASNGNAQDTGPFSRNAQTPPPVTYKHIIDGTSNTLAFGERNTGDVKNANFAAVWAGYTNSGTGATKMSWNAIMGATLYKMRTGDSGTAPAPEACFSSQHGSGANFTFCDGAVKFLAEDINWTDSGVTPLGILNRLGDKNDGLDPGNF